MYHAKLPTKLVACLLACAFVVAFCGMQKGDPTKKLDINTATEEQLAKELDGIGPKKAKAIVDARPFTSIDELDLVPGIGPKTMEKIRDRVTVGAAPAVQPPPQGQQPKAQAPKGNAKKANAGAAAKQPDGSDAVTDPELMILKAYAEKLSKLTLGQLDKLLAEKEEALAFWCSQHNITKSGEFAKGFGASEDEKVRRKLEATRWRESIKLIKEAKAAKEKEAKTTKSKKR